MAESKDKNQECPVFRTINTIGKKWTLLILRDLYCSPRSLRFNELKRSLKEITPTILSKRLKEMEGDNLIQRKILASEIPVKVEYSLTDKGWGLQKIIQDLKEWGAKWEFKNKGEVLTCEDCKKKMKDGLECPS